MKLTTKTPSRLTVYLVGLAAALSAAHVNAQVDEDKSGAWYIYAWNKPGDEGRIGFQGDIQHRNWDAGGDLEQLLIRGGATFTPTSGRVQYTLGVGHIVSEPFGPSGDATREDRLYQEALLPHRIGNKLFMTHRFRFEQRWVDGQDTRYRGRYFIGLNWPLNQDTLGAGARYLSLYNETFVNLNRNIGDGRRVDDFDRNRLYIAFGFSLSDDLRLQLGYMHQQTDTIGKGQLQIGFFHAL